MSPDATAALPNAPFIAAHSENPSFTQLQLLAAFVNAHMGRTGGVPLGSIPEGLDLFLWNFFSGRDVNHLGADGSRLTADQFLRCIYECTLQWLIEQQLGVGTVFTNWLRRHTDRPATWMSQLRVAVSPASPPQAKEPLGAWSALLKPSDKAGPLLLWHWLWAMHYPGRANQLPADWYLPIREDSLFILSTLLILRCLTRTDTHSNRPCLPQARPVTDGGLEVKLERVTGSPIAIYLVHEQADLRFKTPPNDTAGRSRLIRRISLPTARFFDSQARWVVEEPSRTAYGKPNVIDLHVGRQEVIAAGDLIRSAHTPEQFLDALQHTLAKARVHHRATLQPIAV